MTNRLANDIRRINEWLDIPDDVRQYVAGLADRVEALDDQPVEVDASTDLTVTSGLEPDQEIRARAAEIVGAPEAIHRPALQDWAIRVSHVVAYIRDGSKPDA